MELIAGGSLLVLILFYAVAFIVALAFPIAFLVLLFRAVKLLERLVKIQETRHGSATGFSDPKTVDVDSRYKPPANR